MTTVLKRDPSLQFGQMERTLSMSFHGKNNIVRGILHELKENIDNDKEPTQSMKMEETEKQSIEIEADKEDIGLPLY